MSCVQSLSYQGEFSLWRFGVDLDLRGVASHLMRLGLKQSSISSDRSGLKVVDVKGCEWIEVLKCPSKKQDETSHLPSHLPSHHLLRMR